MKKENVGATFSFFICKISKFEMMYQIHVYLYLANINKRAIW